MTKSMGENNHMLIHMYTSANSTVLQTNTEILQYSTNLWLKLHFNLFMAILLNFTNTSAQQR